MSTNLFAILAATYGAISVYFCWRYYLRRRLPSLVCAFMPLGWVAAFGLQVQQVGVGWVPAMFGASLVVAAVSLHIIIAHEMSRGTPFR